MVFKQIKHNTKLKEEPLNLTEKTFILQTSHLKEEFDDTIDICKEEEPFCEANTKEEIIFDSSSGSQKINNENLVEDAEDIPQKTNDGSESFILMEKRVNKTQRIESNQARQVINLISEQSKNQGEIDRCSFLGIENSRYPLVKLRKLNKEDLKLVTKTSTHFKKKLSTNSGPVFVEIDKLKNSVYKCSQCNYFTKISCNYKRHLAMHSGKILLKCPKCDYMTYRRDHLKLHCSVHLEKTLKCLHCEYVTSRKSNLKRHLQHHENLAFFHCSECNYVTRIKEYFIRHSKIHEGENTYNKNNGVYSCSKCDFKTDCKKKLKAHTLSLCGKFLYYCANCKYRTYNKLNLTRHLMTHDTQKLFKCLKCHFGTNYSHHLKRHMRRHEVGSIENKNLRCSECTFRSASKAYLKRHVLMHLEAEKGG